jgi:4a-hydroxytetrahydrobiopterin dehydratase
MAKARLLDDREIDQGLSDLPDWHRQDGALRRTVRAYDFPTAVRVVEEVVIDCQKLNHHPDVDIRYNKVTFSLTTHSAGGITPLDIELAHRIEEATGRLVQGND